MHRFFHSTMPLIPTRCLALATRCLITLTIAVFVPIPALSQDAGEFDSSGFDFGGGTDDLSGFALPGLSDRVRTDDPVTLSADVVSQSGDTLLRVSAEIADHWHMYSTTQPPGGPTKTTFEVVSPAGAVLSGPARPDGEPSRAVSSQYNGLTVEEHEDRVVWTAPLALPAGYAGPVKVKVRGLACDSIDGRCIPVRETLTVNVGDVGDADDASGNQSHAPETKPAGINWDAISEFRDETRLGTYAVAWKAAVASSGVAPGGTTRLRFRAITDAEHHVYELATDDSESSTNFAVAEKNGLKFGKPTADQATITQDYDGSAPAVKYYRGPVTFEIPVEVPNDVSPGAKTVTGFIGYQACTDSFCLPPRALRFEATIQVTGDEFTADSSISLVTAKRGDALDAAAENWVDEVSVAGDASLADSNRSVDSATNGSAAGDTSQAIAPEVVEGGTSFPLLLLFAFLGGIVLNFMPCVLPVIGLKVMSFVDQAGADRRRVFLLNVAYCGGIFFVFALLAGLAIVGGLGWGQQFQNFSVRMGITVGLFAFALSYFGIWEIPVPGLAAGSVSQDLQSREGFAGAFSKGIFATILATPCSGPLLGGVLGATLTLHPAATAGVFMMLALGMSAPYILIGVRPELVSWLPKPGPWMETFKQAMAFLFLFGVAFFFYQFDDADKVPVFVTLIGVWFGCWLIGQVPDWAELRRRLMAWAAGIGSAVAIGVLAFSMLKGESYLPWIDYNERKLQQLQADGKTVLLDFSAKWCVNCHVNTELAIDTRKTLAKVKKLDVVPMYADWTNYDDDITDKLAELDSKSIPLLVIYPGGDPSRPIVLRDLVTQAMVLDALDAAGPSVSGSIEMKGERFTSVSTLSVE